ncbi:hypothetical protein NMY22_g3506 [Coprinellus aureogranulatus]|nr:hypothetical protein NMY22_g3506 [Coprinellus aureogranulatus]
MPASLFGGGTSGAFTHFTNTVTIQPTSLCLSPSCRSGFPPASSFDAACFLGNHAHPLPKRKVYRRSGYRLKRGGETVLRNPRDFWPVSVTPDSVPQCAIRPGLWLSFGHSSAVVDYPTAVILCGWALGIEASLAVPIMRRTWSLRQRQLKSKSSSSSSSSSFFLIATAVLTVMFSITGILYCASAILHLRALGRRNVTGGVLGALGGMAALSRDGSAVSQAVTVGMQLIMHLADVLLELTTVAFHQIYRCFVVFTEQKWVCVLPAIPFLLSVGLSIHGVIAVARYPRLGKLGDPPSERRALSIAPFIAVLSSVLVNILVTGCICTDCTEII